MTALNCVLKVPQYLPQEQRFDIRVLVCCCRRPHNCGPSHVGRPGAKCEYVPLMQRVVAAAD